MLVFKSGFATGVNSRAGAGAELKFLSGAAKIIRLRHTARNKNHGNRFKFFLIIRLDYRYLLFF
jgi:hypothetical protein